MALTLHKRLCGNGFSCLTRESGAEGERRQALDRRCKYRARMWPGRVAQGFCRLPCLVSSKGGEKSSLAARRDSTQQFTPGGSGPCQKYWTLAPRSVNVQAEQIHTKPRSASYWVSRHGQQLICSDICRNNRRVKWHRFRASQTICSERLRPADRFGN